MKCHHHAPGIIDSGNTGVILVQVTRIKPMSTMSDRRRIQFHLLLKRRHQRLDDIWQKPSLCKMMARISGKTIE